MKKRGFSIVLFGLLMVLAGCGTDNRLEQTTGTEAYQNETSTPAQQQEAEEEYNVQVTQNIREPYTKNTRISEVVNDSVFGNYGKLIFPVNRLTVKIWQEQSILYLNMQTSLK